ncbi:hypothetical protein P3547_19885 [Vibrio parahaemolyticus]|nr:hypothetical protein [Vibrio parahaemolyticus]
MANKTPFEMDAWNGNREAKAHFADANASMGLSVRELAEELGGERIGEVKFSAAAMSDDWKECDGTTVQAASFPKYAALANVNRISADGINAITNKTYNDLIGILAGSSYASMQVINKEGKLHIVPTGIKTGGWINAVDDISAETVTSNDYRNTKGAMSVGSIESYASEAIWATDGTNYLFFDAYNTSSDTILVSVTTDFVDFDQHPIFTETSTCYSSAAWFDESDGCFWFAARYSSTMRFYKSADTGQTWTLERSVSGFSGLYKTGTFGDGARWFADYNKVYVFPKWATNKTNYINFYFNEVNSYGRVAQVGKKLALFDNADSSFGILEWKGDIDYYTLPELVGGVNDVLVVGDSVVIAADNGNLYSTTDFINLNHIGSIELASLNTKDIFLSDLGGDRIAATYKDGIYTRLAQFDLVRSPQDLVKLPLCDAPAGTKAYIKVK